MPQEEEKTTRQVSLKNLEPIYRKFVECFDFNVADLVNAMTRSIDVFYPENEYTVILKIVMITLSNNVIPNLKTSSFKKINTLL